MKLILLRKEDGLKMNFFSSIVYFIIAIGATTVGSMTGMGGGVIIKPLMDVMGDYNAKTIGVISCITVFSMAIVSVGKQILAKTKIPYKIAVPLAVGSVAGGYAGDLLLDKIVSGISNEKVTVVQNIVLGILILFVFVYMLNKEKIKGFRLKGIIPALLVGCFLGICSSFLGIGGGPINVALIIFLFSVDTKTATVCSIMTILFAQISKLVKISLTTGFVSQQFDTGYYKILPLMIVGAIAGGFIGAALNRKFPEKWVVRAFNGVQILVLGITIYNIISNLVAV